MNRRLFILFVSALISFSAAAAAPRWTADKAQRWYESQAWLVGANFIPKNAVNPLEMWQRETFDLGEIDRELATAERLGMNTMRVFLHDLVWRDDPKGFVRRLDAFLGVAAKHHIRPLLVLFDSCWDPHPVAGPQPRPRPGVHNSRWVQSPGYAALSRPSEYARLAEYVRGVVGEFGGDRRILAWDVWNEPDNLNEGSYDDPRAKLDYVRTLLPRVFEWARSTHPLQPLTSGVWAGDWSTNDRLNDIQYAQLAESDFVSFHNYGEPADFEKRVRWLSRFHRPIFATEYLARPLGSTFRGILPVAVDYRVAVYNWGFYAGRTQTYIPWDSWQKPYPDSGPAVWFHDIFFSDGEPYRPEETDTLTKLIRRWGPARIFHGP